MRGIGLQPAGMSPAGFGDPLQSSALPRTSLPNVTTGARSGSRLILNGDYQLSPDGQLVGMDNTQQLVLLAVANARPFLQEIDRLDASFQLAITNALTAALSSLVSRGLIEIVGVETRMNEEGGLKPGQAVTVLRWKDTATSHERTVNI